MRGGVVGQLHRDSAVRGGAKPHVAEMARLQAMELLSFLRERSGGRKEQVQPVKDWLGRVALTGCIGLPFDGVRDVVRKALEHLLQNKLITVHKPPATRWKIEDWSLQIL